MGSMFISELIFMLKAYKMCNSFLYSNSGFKAAKE